MDYTFAAQEFVDGLNAKFPDEQFSLDPKGRKYIRIVSGRNGQRSVYCFIDRANGDVLKDAGWPGPAKGARGSLADPKEFQMVMDRADRYGGAWYR